jgi:hypothetical protein
LNPSGLLESMGVALPPRPLPMGLTLVGASSSA